MSTATVARRLVPQGSDVENPCQARFSRQSDCLREARQEGIRDSFDRSAEHSGITTFESFRGTGRQAFNRRNVFPGFVMAQSPTRIRTVGRSLKIRPTRNGNRRTLVMEVRVGPDRRRIKLQYGRHPAFTRPVASCAALALRRVRTTPWTKREARECSIPPAAIPGNFRVTPNGQLQPVPFDSRCHRSPQPGTTCAIR